MASNTIWNAGSATPDSLEEYDESGFKHRLPMYHFDYSIRQVLLVWNQVYPPCSAILHLMTLFQCSGCQESGPSWQLLQQNRQCVWKSKVDKVERHARFSDGVVVLDWSWSFDFQMLRLIWTFDAYYGVFCANFSSRSTWIPSPLSLFDIIMFQYEHALM